MKDDKKVSHILQLYLQWPVFLTALVILAGAAVNLISRKAGLVMLAFTVIYAACAGTLYMYGKKRALGSLVSFASAYQLESETAYGISGAALRDRGYGW